MPNPHITTQDWFYHVTAPKAKGPSYIMVKPASQIPGLSDLPDESLVPGEDDRHCRRKWIRDTDSKYIRLAKAGGRKNLLTFNNDPKLSKEPVLYPRVDWFDHDRVEGDDGTTEENKTTVTNMALPDWYAHEQPIEEVKDIHKKSDEVPKRPLLGFDSKTAWERLEDDKPRLNKQAKTKKKNSSKTESMKTKLKDEEDTKLDMRKLLSMDYQREWLMIKSEEDAKEAELRQSLKKEKDARHQESMKRQKEMKSKGQNKANKPLFKLSRFSKIKPCVDTRWTKLQEPTVGKPVSQ